MPRLLVLAVIFTAELLVLSTAADGDRLAHRGSLLQFLALWGPWILRAIVGFAALFVTFGYLRSESTFEEISQRLSSLPLNRVLLLAHLAAMAVVGALTLALYKNSISGLTGDWIAASWLVAGLAAIVLAGCSVIPLSLWIRMVRGTGYLGLYTGIAVVAACVVGDASRSLWLPVSRVTFRLVEALLRLFVSGVTADPATMMIGTSTFSVEIAKECSGFEGAGLMLAFSAVWLVLFRKESRFPHALLLIPAGVAVMYLLNAARIAALILIGNAGAHEVALGGFHSQAGWIAFNVVALGFSVAARRTPYFIVDQSSAVPVDQAADNPTAAYLVPFLAILGTGMLASAATADFEWLYPVRFFAAAGALWAFRRKYAGFDWKISWHGPAVGILVFALWIALDRLGHAGAASAMPAALSSASPLSRVAWITFRILAAVVTVPIAEELAFRGFGLRRLISPDFESVPFSRFTWFALVTSSLAFGLLHGGRWVAGTLAGLLYALAMVRRGSIGEAVVAHATTNALLAAYVLTFDQWSLW